MNDDRMAEERSEAAMEIEFDDRLLIEAFETPLPLVEAHLAKVGLIDIDPLVAYPAAAELFSTGRGGPTSINSAILPAFGARNDKLAPSGMALGKSHTRLLVRQRTPAMVAARFVGQALSALRRVAGPYLGYQSQLEQWVSGQPTKLRIVENAASLAMRGIPAADSQSASTTELHIRAAHRRMIDRLRERANGQLRSSRAGLDTMAADVTEAEMKRIRTALHARLEERIGTVSSELPGLARRKVWSECELASFRALNALDDVPTARSAMGWLAATLATVIGEALVNAHLFRGELGYVDGAGFALGLGGAIALMGIAAGIGWAQLRRPRRSRRLGGLVLFAAALGAAGFFVLGLAHYREALAMQSSDAALLARATMSASPFAPLADTTLLPYLILNVAGFALVCWKSIPMWGFLDLRRLQLAARRAAERYEDAKEDARAGCDRARLDALNGLDETLDRLEENVQRGQAILCTCEELRDRFKADAEMVSDSMIACEQLYREMLEACHPAGRKHARLSTPIASLNRPELDHDRESQLLHALMAQLVRARDALPAIAGEIAADTSAAIMRIRELAEEAQARALGRGADADNLVRFERRHTERG